MPAWRRSRGRRARAPSADTTVCSGLYATQNFGTDTKLTVKNDGDGGTGDFNREAHLRFDLSGVTGTMIGATLRLVPTSVGQAGIKNAIAVVPSDSWTER